MAKGGRVVVTGDKELDRRLRRLEPKIGKKVARRAMRDAGKIIQREAQDNLERNQTIDTGQLQKGIKVRALKRSRGRVGVQIATRPERKEDYWGGLQLETGTKHVQAEPFLRPAGYENEGFIRRLIVADIRNSLDELAREASRGGGR